MTLPFEVLLPRGVYVADGEVRVWSDDGDYAYIAPTGTIFLVTGDVVVDNEIEEFAVVIAGGATWHITTVYARDLRPL